MRTGVNRDRCERAREPAVRVQGRWRERGRPAACACACVQGGGAAGRAKTPPTSTRRAGGGGMWWWWGESVSPPAAAPRPLAPLLYEAICFSGSQILGEKPRFPGECRGGCSPCLASLA